MNQRLALLFIFFIAFGRTFAQQPNPKEDQAKLSTASKQVTTFSIEAPQLHTTKKIWIYLPKKYDTSKKKYPVIYMHDAQNLFDAKTSYVGEWNIDEKLDSLNAQVIIVGIEHGNEKRIDELTPYKNAKYGGGNADNYLRFIVETLKPEIDTKYRTKTNTKNTGIIGSSLGGLVSYYAVLKYPGIFGKAGVFSPSFWFNRIEINELTQKTSILKNKIYFMCGDNEGDADVIPDLITIHNLITSTRSGNLNLSKINIVKGGQHNEKLWRDGFVKAYLWLF